MTGKLAYNRDLGERIYIAYKVQNRTGVDIAAELGTSQPNVTRWCQRFARENPIRARELDAGSKAPSSAFLARVARDVAAGDAPVTIPGFEDADDAEPAQIDLDAGDDISGTGQIRRTIGLIDSLMKSTEDPALLARLAGHRQSSANNLLRAEKNEKESRGMITMSVDDVEKARASLAAKQAKAAASATHCAECGARIRMRLASDGEDK